jgi:hypothetical protein
VSNPTDTGTDPSPPAPDGPDDTVVPAAGFEVISDAAWDETAVRKVLHQFAYGGHASDSQISTWADMLPEVAITEMLTFSFTNEKLSPAEDASALHAGSLEELQEFWGGDDPENPVRWDKRDLYGTLTEPGGYISVWNIQRAWIQAVITRGINPFLHKIAFYLTNYQMAITINGSKPGLLRAYYDQTMADLVAGRTFTDVISRAAKSAAVARRYDHRLNVFDGATGQFSGNDDFAREYFQLFFRLQGESEVPEYHEGVTIENNALLLTGMEIDRSPNLYGSSLESDWWITPINFTDHTDGQGRLIKNGTYHHADCLEILRSQICGATAADKIDALSPLVANHPEVMDNLPVYVIQTLADDRLTADKVQNIRSAWKSANDDLLSFLRSYAISTDFHSQGRVKFGTAFQRNLTLYNSIILDNHELFGGRGGSSSVESDMRHQGAQVFIPPHDVFGGQTGPEAALNLNIFKDAYTVSSELFGIRASLLSSAYYADESQTAELVWNKNWAGTVPANENGHYVVEEVAEWLWQRMVADGGKNFDAIARAQVEALLAYGLDFGYLVTDLDPGLSDDPDTTYSSSDLLNDPRLLAVRAAIAVKTMDLDSADAGLRAEANRRMNLATSFISALPYTFAMEGR